jgi:drug/metabolite transporter (DMT)-like permease
VRGSIQATNGLTRPSATILRAYACLALSMALVGSYVGFSKALVVVFPVFLLAWLRFGIGALAMARWTATPANEQPLDGPTKKLLFWESFLGNFLFSICMLFGVHYSTALAAGVVMAALPATVALLSWLFLREHIAPRVLAGVACAVAGVALVALAKPQAGVEAANMALGTLLLVGAVLCEASYVVIGKKLTGRVSPKRISALVNLWGLALMTPLGLWQAMRFDFASVTSNTWALLVFYSLAASVWTVWLWMTGLRHVPASRAGVFTVMLPVAAAVVGVAFLGESVTGVQGAAFALALLGIALATWPAPLSPTQAASASGPTA